MTRSLRIEFAGALYHVTARGDRREPIYNDDIDRARWLDILGTVCARFHFSVHAYCQMSNHYHLLVETLRGRLADGMRQLNGVYAQAYNRRHRLVGHVFQGRYGAILCEKENYLKELARYIVLNPVRANIVTSADDWPWSSHRYVMGRETSPPWFSGDYLLSHFSEDPAAARRAYMEFILAGATAKRPLDEVKHQLYLGNVPCAENKKDKESTLQSAEFSRTQKRALVRPLVRYFIGADSFESAVVEAYNSGAFSMAEIARHCGSSRRTIGRIIRAHEIQSANSNKCNDS